MYLLELAVQGVRGFSPAGRFPLKPGYLVLKAPPPGTAPLVALVHSLFFSDGRGADAEFIAPNAGQGKAGLTLLGNDQGTYRLLKQLGGTGALHRVNKETNAFDPVSQDAVEITNVLRTQVGVLPQAISEQIFGFTSSQLPSKRAKKIGGNRGLGSNMPVVAASNVADSERKLAELRKEHAFSREVSELQFKADGLQGDIFNLQRKLEGSEGLQAALADAEAAYDAAPSAEKHGFPKDILERAQRYEEFVARRDRELGKLKGDQPEELGFWDDPKVKKIPPLYKDNRFVGAVAAGAVFMLTGAFLSGAGRYLALLDIPAFGFAAFLAVQYVNELEDAAREAMKGNVKATREKKVREQFEAEAGVVKAAMTRLDADSPKELIELLSQRNMYADKANDLRRQLSEYLGGDDFQQAVARLPQLQEELARVNAEIEQKGTYVRDVREIEREMERLKESIELAKAGRGAVVDSATGMVEVFEDPAPALLEVGTELFGADTAGVVAIIKDRVAQYFTALTDRRYVSVEFDREGKSAVSTAARKFAGNELPPKDLDYLHLAIRLTMVEKYSARFKLPVLIDDALDGVEDAKVALLARMLKHLGTMTQVLHLTPHPGFLQAADVQVTV